MNSLWMGPYMIYFSMVNWIYPLKDYLGETGCYLMTTFRGVHLWEVQQQSFFISIFRFVCLFQGHILQKLNLSPNVSADTCQYSSVECHAWFGENHAVWGNRIAPKPGKAHTKRDPRISWYSFGHSSPFHDLKIPICDKKFSIQHVTIDL